jgi:uncharacterized lipoprotein YmbA
MRYIVLIMLSLFVGCTAPKSYILDSKSVPVSDKKFNYSIGVKNIELPQYLLGKDIPYLQDDNQIIYLENKKWATYLDEHLTNRLVSMLQKSFHTPKVYKYPQNTSKKPDIIIQININKFLANKNSVLLDATCTREGKFKERDRLFSIKEPISSKDDIIDSMNRAFGKLEKRLIDSLEKISF